jgi:dihydropteroate synthase
MQGSPKDMQNNPKYEDVILDLDEFFEAQISKARKYGVQNIVLDVGIGFGKTLEHNLELLRNLSHFQRFGCEILVGASRKSMIEHIMKNYIKDETKVEDRLSGSLAIHLHSINQGASIVRVHDVKEHFQAIKVQNNINMIK